MGQRVKEIGSKYIGLFKIIYLLQKEHCIESYLYSKPFYAVSLFSIEIISFHPVCAKTVVFRLQVGIPLANHFPDFHARQGNTSIFGAVGKL